MSNRVYFIGKYLKPIFLLLVISLTGSNSSFANSLEKAKLFAHDVGTILGFYQSSLATIDYCERRFNTNVTRIFFTSHNGRIVTDAKKLLVKKFGYKLANKMYDRINSDLSLQLTRNQRSGCPEFMRQHMNRYKDIKVLFPGQMKRIFGSRWHLY
ncbi:MAG: hypothetical protein HOO19_18945 [Rhodospirillaceae bacterium]|jgi:hypothetical protein|nr:hypothetical protein [Rhodospirillaceae bacterium]MBT4751417.1 hypothetical protein [Rhodospirillaceae bacterium]